MYMFNNLASAANRFMDILTVSTCADFALGVHEGQLFSDFRIRKDCKDNNSLKIQHKSNKRQNKDILRKSSMLHTKHPVVSKGSGYKY